MQKAISDLLRSVALYRQWIYQAYYELSVRYKRTFLGSLWIASGMVALSLCISLVMGGIMGMPLKEVLPYIMGGILVFQLGGSILNSAGEYFISGANIIRNHAYPYMYYVFENVAYAVLQFLHNLVVFWILSAVIGAWTFPHWSILLGLPIVLINMLTWGTVAAMAAARFRDMRFMLPFVGQLVFYITPIIWHPGRQGRSELMVFNPWYGLVDIIRAPLLGTWAEPLPWSLALGMTVAGIIAWLIAFPIFRRRIPFWV